MEQSPTPPTPPKRAGSAPSRDRWAGDGAPGRGGRLAAPEAPETSSEDPGGPVALPDASAFSALNLRDRVVIMLLFDQIVSEERVAEVWALWKQQYAGEPQEPLWRFLTLVPEVDRELVYAEAARVYGIEEARIARLSALPLIEETHRRLPKRLWEQMVERRLMPIAEAEQHHSHRQMIILASHDPTHPDVESLIPQLKLGSYELRYAPELDIVALLAEAFPWKFKPLKKALEAERKLFAPSAVAGENPAPAPAAPEAPDEEAWVDTPQNSSSVVRFFEELLVQAVRGNAAGVCAVPNEQGEIELYLLDDEALNQWRVVQHITPNALFTVVKNTVLRAGFVAAAEARKEIITRWIDGAPVRFRVTMQPSGDIIDRECLVIRVVNG